MKKDPSPSLSFSAQVKKGPPTSCLAVSVSASDEGNWTPFLRRSRYTSFTSLTSTPPGKPCDHVWIQETESFREKGAAKQNNSESDDQKIRAWQLWSSLRKRKLLFNAIHKMHTFYRFFFFFFLAGWGGGGGYLFLAVPCSTWDPNSPTRDWTHALGSEGAGSTLS